MDHESRVPGAPARRTIEAVATFAAMMHADARGRRARVAEARRTLARLGITVGFRRRGAMAARGGGGHAK